MNNELHLQRIKTNQITNEHKGLPILYVNKGFKEYGVIAGVDKVGVYIYFGMNVKAQFFGFKTPNKFYLTQVI